MEIQTPIFYFIWYLNINDNSYAQSYILVYSPKYMLGDANDEEAWYISFAHFNP